MAELKDLLQTADFKSEKHVPVIEVPARANKGALLRVTVTVGKEVAHPNKTEHHIRWIAVYFQPKGEKFPYELTRVELNAHGESAQGPDTSTIYAHPEATVAFKTDKSGTFYAASYCNIHGLWQSAKELAVE